MKPTVSASVTRCRSRPSTAKVWRELYERLVPFSRSARTSSRAVAKNHCSSRSSAGRMSENRHWSTALIGEERMLTGPEAGITRDAIAIDWIWQGHPLRLVDTAGLRRKPRVEGKLEQLSVA